MKKYFLSLLGITEKNSSGPIYNPDEIYHFIDSLDDGINKMLNGKVY